MNAATAVTTAVREATRLICVNNNASVAVVSHGSIGAAVRTHVDISASVSTPIREVITHIKRVDS